MTVPLVILAVGSIVAGWIGAGLPVPFLHQGLTGFGTFVYAGEHGHSPEFHLDVMLLSTLVAMAGLAAGYMIYVKRVLDPARVRERLHGVYVLLVKKYYMDELYDWLVLRVQQGWAALCDLFDRRVLIRTMVNGTASLTRGTGERLRLVQTGRLQSALFVLGAGTVLLLLLILVGGK
jgi:NADH-quinone oxidoreductase subunit L